jgi:GNAT superfamily N-acetyltransferase
MEILFKTTRPSREAYHTLFETTGWNHEYQLGAEALGRVLDNSQFVVSAYADEQLVGFGRVLTDGVLHGMIYDLIVHPIYQRQGIGTEILRRLVQWCQAAHLGDIQLFCARGKRAFYERHGFVARPDEAPGMQYQCGPRGSGGQADR